VRWTLGQTGHGWRSGLDGDASGAASACRCMDKDKDKELQPHLLLSKSGGLHKSVSILIYSLQNIGPG
jgi:hypothetical protein